MYALENLGITKINRKKVGQAKYSYKWSLTKKGQKIIDKNKNLKFLWESGRLKEFYKEIKRILEE